MDLLIAPTTFHLFDIRHPLDTFPTTLRSCSDITKARNPLRVRVTNPLLFLSLHLRSLVDQNSHVSRKSSLSHPPLSCRPRNRGLQATRLRELPPRKRPPGRSACLLAYYVKSGKSNASESYWNPLSVLQTGSWITAMLTTEQPPIPMCKLCQEQRAMRPSHVNPTPKASKIS